ncbi:Uncharacterised protein [Pluralibacter gergoviae]|nr:Uncharacterised protein [Pluralibacter gergoviae]
MPPRPWRCSPAAPTLTSVLTSSAPGKRRSPAAPGWWAAWGGGWPKAAHIAVTVKKGSGLVDAVQAALNGAMKSGDYDRVLNRWGEGVERIAQSEINPPGLGD